ncbi:MAG: energy transducer TonB [Pseudomonadota bacterium]
MRVGVTFSSVGHVAILAFALISLPSPDQFDASLSEPLPVELVSVEELTNLRQGELDAPEEETPANVPTPEPEPDVAEEPAEQEEVVVEEQPEPAPIPEPEPAAEPEPTPEPLPEPEDVAEPTTEPVTEPEAPVEAEVEPEPTPEPTPETALAEPIPLPNTRPNNIPQRPRQAQRQPEPEEQEDESFAADRIAALLDKSQDQSQRESQGQGAGSQQASLGAPSGSETAMSQSELDYLRSQISRCWSPPVGAADPEALVVRVQIALDPAGNLTNAEILEFRASPIGQAAADSALRAVRRCQPYDLPAAKYDAWSRISLRFDPRDMLR